MATRALAAATPANNDEPGKSPRRRGKAALTVVQPDPTPVFRVEVTPVQQQRVAKLDLVQMAQQQADGADWRVVHKELRLRHDWDVYLPEYAAERVAAFYYARLGAIARGGEGIETDPDKHGYINPIHWAVVEARSEELRRRGLGNEDYRQIADFTTAANLAARSLRP